MALALGPKRRAWSGGNSVAIVADGINRRIVSETRFGQDVKGPGRLPHDAEGRRPVADDLLAGCLLESVLAEAQIITEASRRMAVNALVVPAMTGDLVAGAANGADQIGVVLGNLADDEKRGLDAAL